MKMHMSDNDPFKMMFADFARRHPQVFDAYEDLTVKNAASGDFSQSLKLLWFQHCVEQDSFSGADRKTVQFMKKSVKNMPVFPLNPDEKDMLRSMMAKYDENTQGLEF